MQLKRSVMNIYFENNECIDKRFRDLFLADKAYDSSLLMDEIRKVVIYHNFSLQYIESFLRQNNCHAYLIAKKPDTSLTDLTVEWPDRTERRYYLYITIRTRVKALKDVLEESLSYHDNYRKLDNTGFFYQKITIYNYLNPKYFKKEDSMLPNLDNVPSEKNSFFYITY